jgi:hypothetical protein
MRSMLSTAQEEGDTHQGLPPHAKDHSHLSYSIPKFHKPHLPCYQHTACPYKALRVVAQSPATNDGISCPSPLDRQVLAFHSPCPAPPHPLRTDVGCHQPHRIQVCEFHIPRQGGCIFLQMPHQPCTAWGAPGGPLPQCFP